MVLVCYTFLCFSSMTEMNVAPPALLDRSTPSRAPSPRSRSDDPEDLERMAEEGLRQIRTREYYRSLKGKTYLYGVCLQNKKAKVLFEEMDL